MFCTNCGKKVDEEKMFCTFCGTKLGTANDANASGDSTKIFGIEKKKLLGYGINVAVGIAVIVAVIVKLVNSGPDLQAEAAGLLKQSLEETLEQNEELSQYVNVTEVKDCVLVKEEGNKYTGLAKAVYEAKKANSKGVRSSATVQYDFKVTYDGTNIMLQDGQASDAEHQKLLTLLTEIMSD